ncbi:FimV family protein [Iodobacter arcticus]|uniref:FimV family protein n=1 Tax=Iodobacter arcticus TaxID=590593 RepID=A0ABW2QSU2_9NEIS
MLCLALALAWSGSAAALTLGELSIQSAVGQRFRGSVSYQLSPEDGLAEDCSKLSITAPNNDLPGIGQATLRLQSKERAGRILIQSNDAVYEPMAGFSIKMECKGQQLQRSYTVFLDPAPLNLPSVAEDSSQAASPKATPAPVRSRRAAAAIIKPDGQTAPRSALKNTTTPAPSVVIPLPSSNGQLRIESELSLKNQAPAVLSPEELKTKIAMMQSLQEQLQSEMARLQQSMLHLQTLSGASVAVSSSSPAPAATLSISNSEAILPSATPAPPPVAPKRLRVNESAGNNSWWMAVVLALLAAGAGFGLWLRRKKNQNTWDADAESAISQVSRTHNAKPANAQQAEHSLFRHSQLFYGGIEVQEEDGSATLERAQLLVAQGETDQAIELLYHTIEENEANNEPWLLLFRVLRQQGMKTEYAQLARRFHDLGGDADDWALVRNIGYRLDPDNPLYSAHLDEAKAADPAQMAIKEVHDEITIKPTTTSLAKPVASEPAEIVIDTEPPREQDAMLMAFLSPAAEVENNLPQTNAPQIISLDLPSLEFSPPEEENSPLDISLLNNVIEEETIEASAPDENAEAFEEIDLVELEIELQPPLSVFEPRKS